MRVIAGNYKGRRLFSPEGESVRPTTDRVKEAIFSMLAPYLPDAVVVDLFAGSGALGIEALSRGAKRAYFCDASAASAALVKRNLALLSIREQAVVLTADWRQAIRQIGARETRQVSLVLIDAPYDLCDHYVRILQSLESSGALAEGALVLIERDAKKDGYTGQGPEGWIRIREKRYGVTAVDLWERSADL